jgi:prepilin peptidase CpaA
MLPGLALSALLAIAAWRDVVTRTIPDRIVLLIAALGLAVRSAAGWSPLLLSTATAALLFVVLLACAMRGLLGGGDVKLAAALALGLPPGIVWDFIALTVLVGGLLGLGYIAGRRFAPRLGPAAARRPLARFLAVETRRLRRGGPLPYGVAIAVGGIITLFSQPGG